LRLGLDNKSSNANQKLSAALDSLAQDEALLHEDNFVERVKALDFLELHFMDAFEDVNTPKPTSADGLTLDQRVHLLKMKLDRANESLFAHLVASIRSHERLTFKQYLQRVEQQASKSTDPNYVSYDEVDSFIWGLLDVGLSPEEPEELEPDLVYLQPSPARTILEVLQVLPTDADDIFYDLGSGLGHVPILVNLLTGIKSKGVEIQEFYCRYSNKCLSKLGLSDTEFIHADARNVDYDDGTIFYMYTPFRGNVLRQVLAKLEAQSKRRQIKICAYGPCTVEVAEQNWLRSIYHSGKIEGGLSIFTSR
jgi:hypothetical protein